MSTFSSSSSSLPQLMLDDLLELTTTLIHPDHEPNISDLATSKSTDTMGPRSRHTKSGSIASTDAEGTISGTEFINGGMLPPATPSPATTLTRTKNRSARSTTSPLSAPVVVVPATHVEHPHHDIEILKLVGAVILSTVLEASLQTAASVVAAGDVAAVSKSANTWVEISGLLAWKIVKLSLYWLAGFDGTLNLSDLSTSTD